MIIDHGKNIPEHLNFQPGNSGMEEQEQNGVIAPNKAAKKYCNPYSLREVK